MGVSAKAFISTLILLLGTLAVSLSPSPLSIDFLGIQFRPVLKFSMKGNLASSLFSGDQKFACNIKVSQFHRSLSKIL